ncbi:cation-translocating P-type ATPase [Marinobacter fonticola]|uniref:cation-translocating P-type ATPase n=1 Tax=Marinobacter fonticola TaxID=2603215 RepID=UPI0011E67916|nr:cation-translocating P-type ATPase [Marinobacter fonticola]
MPSLPRIRVPALAPLLRQALGQVRQVTEHGPWLLIELRDKAGEDSKLLESLESALARAGGCKLARYIPEFERLVVLRDDEDSFDRQDALAIIEKQERRHGWAHRFYATKTQFPGEHAARYRTLLEMGLDIAGFGGGLLVRRVSTRGHRFFTDVLALSILAENTPEIRQPIEHILGGEENTDLALRFVNVISESFSQGGMGSLVDLVHRTQDWQASQERQQSWERLRDRCFDHIEHDASPRFEPLERACPVPAGLIEQHQSASEKWSLAAFSTGMAFTHNLTQSMSTLLSSVPRPALLGRKSFCATLVRDLARKDTLLFNPEVLQLLDRVDRIVLDADIARTTQLTISTRFHTGRIRVPLEVLDALLEQPSVQHGKHTFTWREVRKASGLTERVRKWWQASGQPIESLRLVRRNGRTCAAVLVHEVVDKTVESIMARIRKLDLKVTVLSAEKDDIDVAVRKYQRRGETLMAIGQPALLRGADIAVGILGEERGWPFGAHLVTDNPLDTLWRLLTAVHLARTVAKQGVELAKIDAFSGLILSLEKVDRRVISRIRLASNLANIISVANGYRLGRRVKAMPENVLRDLTPWHALDTDAVLERLEQRVAANGHEPDAQDDRAAMRLWKLWLEEMSSPLMPVLFSGAGLAALTGALGDAIMIGSVISLNGLVGSLQRRRTEKQLEQLAMTTEELYSVERGQETVQVEANQLQPGDIITVEFGDVIPADARLLAAKGLEMDESSLTGESLPVKKNAKPCYSTNLAERTSMLYEGTSVVLGTGQAVVVAVGPSSEARRAHTMVSEASSGVEKRLEHLSEITVPMAAFSGLALLVSGLSRNQPIRDVIGSGISMAVAAVPEGLPIMATLAQLGSAGRLSRQGALARNPRAIEALGRMSVLCADKTGTLTEGRLALKFVAIDNDIVAADDMNERALDVLMVGMLASPEDALNGDAAHFTDRALATAALDHRDEVQKDLERWKRIKDLPFKSERGYHAALFEHDGVKRLCVKGAPEILLERCNRWHRPDGRIVNLDKENRARLTELSHSLASRGYRVLAVAERPARSDTLNRDKVSRLVFRGFLALADPVRPAAQDAVAKLMAAGIRVSIITGDHPVTAAAIAEELGINGTEKVVTGADIDAMNDDALKESARKASVFARVTPEQKARIVTALQHAGEVVGMTGDGANDAAALRLAEVGIALGENCSVVAQQAADLQVVDGRIETIVSAVLEGRALWTSVRDAVSLLVGGNLGEIGFTLVAGLLEGRSPLNARQLILINVLTDTVPALAVALGEPTDLQAKQLMSEGPEASLGDALTREIHWRSGLTGGITTAVWALDRKLWGPEHASTVAMLTLIGTQLSQTVLVGKGSRQVNLAAAGAFAGLCALVETPGLNRFFGCRRPGITGWMTVAGSLGVSFAGAWFLPRLQETSKEVQSEWSGKLRRWLTRSEREEQPRQAALPEKIEAAQSSSSRS